MSKPWSVYILECGNGTLYTGVTNDLDRRVREHYRGKGGRYTRTFKAERLLYHECYDNKPEAYRRERQIKTWPRKRKLALVNVVPGAVG